MKLIERAVGKCTDVDDKGNRFDCILRKHSSPDDDFITGGKYVLIINWLQLKKFTFHWISVIRRKSKLTVHFFTYVWFLNSHLYYNITTETANHFNNYKVLLQIYFIKLTNHQNYRIGLDLSNLIHERMITILTLAGETEDYKRRRILEGADLISKIDTLTFLRAKFSELQQAVGPEIFTKLSQGVDREITDKLSSYLAWLIHFQIRFSAYLVSVPFLFFVWYNINGDTQNGQPFTN